MYILSPITPSSIKYPLVAVRITQQQHQRGGVDNVNPSPLYYHCPVKLLVKLNNECAREQYLYKYLPADLLEHGGGHGAGPGEGGGGARQAAELLALLLLVDEVAARPVGAVAHDPVLLTVLGLVFVVPNNVLLQNKTKVVNRLLSRRLDELTLSSCLP